MIIAIVLIFIFLVVAGMSVKNQNNERSPFHGERFRSNPLFRRKR
ncbi:MAG: hypothetical protein SPG41_07340 [Erysipelotrichaceae bacterium]|nr:hypothetical protein [Solobacterium sp.]MDY2953313.1 hypothetical protein [Erysipelotrichaceae bacterium]MDY3793559.1 hypothetical protein [Erysipelotrichaceae bacterium]MDY4791681.1 hypothetical protein [Erysipelotrichaceae bacterium]MDY5402409.1 hypothetical protein [Erysipelotrichaceae bacterium]